MKTQNSIFQIKVSLTGTRPKVWRRLLVRPDTPLRDLHLIIQTAMGWTDMHLHQFIKDRRFYSARLEDIEWSEYSDKVDYSNLTIRDILRAEKEKINYEYDFGDGWMHEIKLEKILPDNGDTEVPHCAGGKMNCPPEDCGGVWGYAYMLAILKDPIHEDYEYWVNWLEEEFDPEHFDREEVNRLLKEENYGCYGWF